MLTSSVVAGTNVVVVGYGHPVSADELLDVQEEIDAVVQRRGGARLLVVYDHLSPVCSEPRAMWAKLRTARLLSDVDRVAVVADTDWIDGPGLVDGVAGLVDVAGFRPDRRPDAVAWLRE